MQDFTRGTSSRDIGDGSHGRSFAEELDGFKLALCVEALDDLGLGLAFLRVFERGVLAALLDAEAQDAVEVYLPPARPSLGRHRERCVLVRDHALEHRRATSASWLPEATAHVVRASAPPRGPPREQVVAFCGSQSVPEAPIWGPPMARKAVKHNATAHSPAILALPAFRRTNPWHCASQPRRARPTLSKPWTSCSRFLQLSIKRIPTPYTCKLMTSS